MTKDKRLRFYTWAMAQVDRQDDIGQFARDLAAGDGIPSGDAWLAHWMGKETAEDALIARWRAAWEEWEGGGNDC